MSPGYSSIFKRIRQEAGLEALKLARTMEKTSYKLEAHYRHLRFSHKALEQQWIPKSLRFKPPGSHPIFKRIMERASKHCLRARISICHSQIQSLKNILDNSSTRFTSLVRDDISSAMSQFLKHRAYSVRSTIEARHANKFNDLSKEIEASQPRTINKENWVVNISKKPLSSVERSILEKGPKFAPTPRKVPTKDIVAEVEAAIVRLPEDTKENLYEQQRRQSFIGPIYHPITISQKLKGKH